MSCSVPRTSGPARPRAGAQSPLRSATLRLWLTAGLSWLVLVSAAPDAPGQALAEAPAAAQFDKPELDSGFAEAKQLIRLPAVREDFHLRGKGFAVAVVSTGLRATHVDFKGRVVAQRNFTNDGGPDDATDEVGNGTYVAGIVAADGVHVGVAREANVIPLKVLSRSGGGTFQAIEQALGWVVENRERYRISVVVLPIGDGGNFPSDDRLPLEMADRIRKKVQALREARVAVVAAAGNGYYEHKGAQGMTFPAILRETVSVGAVFDSKGGSFTYPGGAKVFSTEPGQITPYTQRLHEKMNPHARTDVFAPSGLITSSGIRGDEGSALQTGTSGATGVVGGVLVLMQECHVKATGQLPTVDQLETWLRRGGVRVMDGAQKPRADNAPHTELEFVRLDAYGAVAAMRRDLQIQLLHRKRPFGND